MLITKPDFYDSFKCRAGECTDSCCIGWEIDIDDETMRKYENENDSLSVKLNRFTDREKQCFILTEDDRCPFLKSDGLCELILTKGEDMLCEICHINMLMTHNVANHVEDIKCRLQFVIR